MDINYECTRLALTENARSKSTVDLRTLLWWTYVKDWFQKSDALNFGNLNLQYMK